MDMALSRTEYDLKPLECGGLRLIYRACEYMGERVE